MTNRDLFKNINKKRKIKKEIQGHYFDGEKSWTLYKDENGKTSMLKDKKRTLEDKKKRTKK